MAQIKRLVVNDWTTKPKFPFFGPVPHAYVVLGPDEERVRPSSSLPFFLK